MTNPAAEIQEVPPEGWTKALAKICIARRGASIHQVIADLEKRELFPRLGHIHTLLSQMVKRGFLSADEKAPCCTCGRPRKTYMVTDKGRVHVAVPA